MEGLGATRFSCFDVSRQVGIECLPTNRDSHSSFGHSLLIPHSGFLIPHFSLLLFLRHHFQHTDPFEQVRESKINHSQKESEYEYGDYHYFG
jgi:hypothetical protein